MSDLFSSSPLAAKLQAALISRDARQIRRRLPDPSTSTPSLADFNSNDYLSLSTSSPLRSLYLQKLSQAPSILGSGGSRLLVNGTAHAQLEARLKAFFGSEEALLFNSGFDANVAFFECVPQPGDVIVYDEHIHASVHDGMKRSRVGKEWRIRFGHNDVGELDGVLRAVKGRLSREGKAEASVFVAVESLYSMDGTFAPLTEICDGVEEVFGKGGNGYVVVDEAHATGLYGPQGRGRVAMLGLEGRVLARLCTFGKALAASGAVLLTNRLIRDYMLNYARPLIYTTSPSYASVIAVDCSFDLLNDGTAQELANKLLHLASHFLTFIRPLLRPIPTDILSLPPHLVNITSSAHCLPLDSISPIVPLHTRYPRALSACLHKHGMNARPITWPTVPKGKDRVRVCLHAGNTLEEVERLAKVAVGWAQDIVRGREDEILLTEQAETQMSTKEPWNVMMASKL
ncbi:hypothetical protein AX17_006516 [Amanita inopinata Kibby_2008]|nr:hypothetical protein AX17_006516 [Amanita inopinata Kibby_2008]